MTKQLLLVSANKSITLKSDPGGDTTQINGLDVQPDSGVDHKTFAHSEKRKFYQRFLSSQFENLMVLSGAGTSVGCDGKTMGELWNEVNNILTSSELEKLCKAIGYLPDAVDFSTLPDKDKDLEKLLSRANTAQDFVKDYKKSKIDIKALVEKAEKVIHDNCKITLKPDAPHELFLNKVTNRKLKDPRVKIFTLNYDTLFEQAAVSGGFTVIDGFSYSNPRTLNGRNFDYDIIYRENSRIKEEESFIPKVFHLFKPHGSVNWEYEPTTEKVIINESVARPLMIYPKDSKYENSYEQPFFEMMSRFQQNIRKENVLLICIGFSFGDKHIVTAIKEAVTQNPSFRLLIVCRTIKETDAFKWFIDKASQQENVILIAEEFKDFAQNYPYSKIYSDPNKSIDPNDPA